MKLWPSSYKIWHEGLLFKLKQNGGEGNLLSLLSSYIHRRLSSLVFRKDPTSALFLINDIEKGIQSQVRFFADDTMIFLVVGDPL